MTAQDQDIFGKEISKMAALARSMLQDDTPKELEFLFAIKQQTTSRIAFPPYNPRER